MAPFLFLLVAIKWSKKWVDFVKIKFDVNENIEWHCMQLELIEFVFNQVESKVLNWIKIHWINFKLNWIEMKCKLIHKILKICSSLPSSLTMALKKKHNSKEIDLKSFIINFELKSILVGIYY